jgi:hypothetical protein
VTSRLELLKRNSYQARSHSACGGMSLAEFWHPLSHLREFCIATNDPRLASLSEATRVGLRGQYRADQNVNFLLVIILEMVVVVISSLVCKSAVSAAGVLHSVQSTPRLCRPVTSR